MYAIRSYYAKQFNELVAEGAVGGVVEGEIIHIQAETTIISQVDNLIDIIHSGGLAIRGHAHHFILAVIHPEAKKGGKR